MGMGCRDPAVEGQLLLLVNNSGTGGFMEVNGLLMYGTERAQGSHFGPFGERVNAPSLCVSVRHFFSQMVHCILHVA